MGNNKSIEHSDSVDFDTPERCSEIICTECHSPPRLLSLDKNAGTTVCCDCDDVKHHQDSIPYEFAVQNLPDSWVVIEDAEDSDEVVDDDQQRLSEGI